MKKIIALSVLFTFTITILTAAIITVDNNLGGVGDYTNLQDAHNAASSGDKIYVYPSIIPYDAISVSKRLYFYGVGFDLDEYPGYQNSPITSIINGSFSFQPGSEFSEIEGFDGGFNVLAFTSNITIKRNKLEKICIAESNVSNVVIIQNDINCYSYSIATGNSVDSTNVYIYNNIILSSSYAAIRFSTESNNNSWTIINNILRGNDAIIENTTPNSVIFSNNIILEGSMSNVFTNNGIVQYNISNSSQLPDDGTNILNVDMNTVFVNPNGDYHLLSGSPAIGTGEMGVDMGIYGGNAPYVDGGIPSLPSIYDLDVTNVVTPETGMDIEIKVRSNEE